MEEEGHEVEGGVLSGGGELSGGGGVWHKALEGGGGVTYT